MTKFKSPVPLWAGYPLLFVLGVGTGIIASGYEWSRRGTLEVPAEIVVTPPQSNVIACFPDMSFFSALRFQKQLGNSWIPDSCQLQALIQQWNRQDTRSRLNLLRSEQGKYSIVAVSKSGPQHLTLATERGNFLLHPIPKRLHEKYDSLVHARQ
ncbi:hypothetical protein [Hymenobacter sp. APR13]|uniref:hypothetical protein n=1 Tax=Hymenobacter sp. APR13 TaxID=1356852 RepID=UPI0004E04DB7|nr:hypothetical protein [Hymenobacter sp. APR13]AII50936.1 hypothetical protein N008_02930 [Hymenobacter sp. APR13]